MARIERGRRTESRLGNNQYQGVTPGATSLTAGERKKRSEERTVAAWFDAQPEPLPAVEANGWKKLVAEVPRVAVLVHRGPSWGQSQRRMTAYEDV